MIGTPIKATLWQITFRHRAAEESDDYVGGNQLLVTADPSGADVYEVAKRVVLKGAQNNLGFEVIHVARQAEVSGLALVAEEATHGNYALMMTKLHEELADARRVIVQLGGIA